MIIIIYCYNHYIIILLNTLLSILLKGHLMLFNQYRWNGTENRRNSCQGPASESVLLMGSNNLLAYDFVFKLNPPSRMKMFMIFKSSTSILCLVGTYIEI